ncbi:unnamed protein product, partial [Ectocarpus sp. 12 AP-2014]
RLDSSTDSKVEGLNIQITCRHVETRGRERTETETATANDAAEFVRVFAEQLNTLLGHRLLLLHNCYRLAYICVSFSGANTERTRRSFVEVGPDLGKSHLHSQL